MKNRTAALCLLLVCAALFASCGGAIELSYENGAYRNEKSGAAYVMAPLCYRAISRLDAEEIAKIVGTKSEKVLYAIEGLDSSLWLTDENFDLYHSETVTLPALWEMAVARISLCLSGAYAVPVATIERSEQIADVVETYQRGTTIPGNQIIPQPETRYELLFVASDYPGIAYVLEYWKFAEEVDVYAKLNADGSIPDLYPGIKSEITEQGEAVFHLGKNLMYDRVNDCFYAVGDVLESYFFTE